MDPSNHTKITITRIQRELPGVSLLYFESDDASAITYEPGQFLTFIAQKEPAEVRRSYSIVSTPILNEPLGIAVKRIDNGLFSRYLVDQARPGDQLITTGAGGLFTLPQDLPQQLFFFGAGTGITPLFSLLKTVLHAHSTATVVLVYSNHSEADTLFLQPLQELASAFPHRLHIEWIFSNNPDLARAHLHNDYLLNIIAAHVKGVIDTPLFYLCGPPAYMRLCSFTLQREGVSAENIKKEIFVSDKLVIRKLPPDKHTRTVTVQQGNLSYRFEVPYPQTILQAARLNGYTLPFSCESGQCGSCVARRIKGDVWISHNEVLTDIDLQNGLTLTCVGHPVSGNLHLEI